MAKNIGKWVQQIKCWNCNKTGKIQDPNNPDKEIKCQVCAGNGYIQTSGTLSS